MTIATCSQMMTTTTTMTTITTITTMMKSREVHGDDESVTDTRVPRKGEDYGNDEDDRDENNNNDDDDDDDDVNNDRDGD